MDYEIEFFPVGEASRAGDAIVLRYVSDNRHQIIVIDGGTDTSGQAVVDHILGVYGTDIVDHVISTHPDTDHSCGLRAVLRQLEVRNLWIHGLWYHALEIMGLFENKNWSLNGLQDTIRKQYPVIEELLDLAHDQGTRVQEPFAGSQIGPFTVLGPRRDTYQYLIPQFRKTPAPDVDYIQHVGMWLGSKGLIRRIIEGAAAAVVNLIPETWNNERLKEGGITAAENESSTILYGDFGHTKMLLTADAGTNALRWAVENATEMGISLDGLNFIQVPHHGSRSNVSPSILNVLLGYPLPAGSAPTRSGIVSSPKDDSKHPRGMVLNAFKRRGVDVHKTQGIKFRYHSGGMPERANEGRAQPFEFIDRVEDYD